jgi:NADPH:quinone reductase-like Zn-dependent oxidoreductase
LEAKYVRFDEFGSPQTVLKVDNKTIQRPKTGEVLVRMISRPINPSDLIPIRGGYSHRISLPSVPGYEGIGIVEEIGPSMSYELLGRRVLPLRGEGTWQQYVRTSADWAVPIPEGMDDYIAAQLYINPITAWLTCTQVLNLSSEDVLLVNACGSSIGRIYCQLARIMGFKLIAVTRNNTYTEELLQLGASKVIDSTDTPLSEMVMEFTNGRGASAAIDSVGGTSGSELAFCMRPDAVLLSIGLLSGLPLHWAELASNSKVIVKQFHLRHWNQHVSVQTWQETFNNLKDLVMGKRLGILKPDSLYVLTDVLEAVRIAETSRRNTGKIFLTG